MVQNALAAHFEPTDQYLVNGDFFFNHFGQYAPQSGDAFADIFRRGVGEIQAHGVVPATTGEERFAWHKSDLFFDGTLKHLR